MRRLCIWLLERVLPDEWCDAVIGDIDEHPDKSSLWVMRQTIAAIFSLRDRSYHGDRRMPTFLNDMRIGARHLRRAPAFAITAILTLAVAIGATAAIFSIVDPVLLRSLPYPSPNRLAFLWERNTDGTFDNMGFETARDLGTRATSIERWAAVGSWDATLGDNEPEHITGDRVSWTYFRTLGVAPMLGRDFLEEEDQPDRNLEVILGNGLWRRRYGADSSIIGKTIPVSGRPMTVVGVMPATFDNVISPSAEIWRVLGYAPGLPYACRTCHHLRMVARFKAGVPQERATAELNRLFASIAAAFPKEYATVGITPVRLQHEVTRGYRAALLALGGAVFLMLLIAFANVINLQLARSVRRRGEFAIRSALGAGRARLVEQLLAEGLVLAVAGGGAGLIVARVLLPVLIAQLPRELPRLAAIHLDAMAFGAVASLVAALTVAMALVPGRMADRDVGGTLRSGRRLAAGAHRTRAALVVGEIALTAMLLASAALVAKSLTRLLDVNPGFDAHNLLSLEVDAVGAKYASDASIYAYHDRVRDAVRAVPGVASVSLSNQLPLGGNVDRYGIVDADNPPQNPEAVPSGDRYVVTPDFRSTMRIPLVRGRWITDADARDTNNKVVVVSEALATRMWPRQDALGKHIRMGGNDAPSRTVVGVVGNVKHTSLDAQATLQFYAPERQWLFSDNAEVIVVRTTVDAASVAQAVRKAVAALDPSLPVIRIATMDQLISRSTAQRRLALILFATFASAALLLAVAGIYGVVASSVAERTREIGLRAALGATPGEIVKLIVFQGARLGAAGLMLGLAGILALTRYLQSLLFGVGAHDPATIVTVTVVLAGVTLAACAIPAMRAVRVDPVEALRSE